MFSSDGLGLRFDVYNWARYVKHTSTESNPLIPKLLKPIGTDWHAFFTVSMRASQK